MMISSFRFPMTVIRWVCPYTADDGFTIQCDACNVWQHAGCVCIAIDDVPEEYLCEMCDPKGAMERNVDRNQAEQGMRLRLETLEREAKGGTGVLPQQQQASININTPGGGRGGGR